MAWYFCVRIGARGDADTRLGARSYLARSKPKTHPCYFLLAEGGVGEAALKLKGWVWVQRVFGTQVKFTTISEIWILLF